MSDIKKTLDALDALTETVAGCVASVAMPLGATQKRGNPSIYAANEQVEETSESDKPNEKSPAEFGLWKNSVLIGKEQKARRQSKKQVREDIGPDKNDPWEQGWRANPAYAYNPYEPGTPEYEQWADGQAERQAQPRHYDESIEDDIPDLEEVGEPIKSYMDAERRLSSGDRIFAFHEMDDEPHEIFNVEELAGYAYDRLLAVPKDLMEKSQYNGQSHRGMVESNNLAQQSAIAISKKKKADIEETQLDEKKDACYNKVKSRYKVWPSAYASGALVQCRKVGAKNWGKSKNESAIAEAVDQLEENLNKWFKEKWVRFGPDGEIRGSCAREKSTEGKPKCLPKSKAQSLGKKGRASAAARKRRKDPDADRSGAAINVNTKKKKTIKNEASNYRDSMTDAEWEREYQREKLEKELARKEIEKNHKSKFKTKEEAIQYANDKLKTFKDSKIGMSVYAMPDGGFDVASTARTAATEKLRKLISDAGGKHLGTLGPRYTKHKMKEQEMGESKYTGLLKENNQFNKFRVGQRATFKSSQGREFPVIITAVDYDDEAVKFKSADNKPFPNGELELEVDPGWRFLTPERYYDPNSLVPASSYAESIEMPSEYNDEYDNEAGMAESNLHTISRAARELIDLIDDRENLPEWVQEKIAKVEGMITTARDYLQSQQDQGINPVQEDNELDRPEIQAALSRMAKRHGKEKWSTEQLAALGKKLAAPEKKKLSELGNSTIPGALRPLKLAKLSEDNLSEEQLLARELAKKLELFMKSQDRDLGKKSKDRDIIAKVEKQKSVEENLAKDIKRLVKGTDAESRAAQEITKSMASSEKNDMAGVKKHLARFDKFKKLGKQS